MDKKLCRLYDDEDPHFMLLSDDQIAILGWLAHRGYALSVEIISSEKIKEISYDDWAAKVVKPSTIYKMYE